MNEIFQPPTKVGRLSSANDPEGRLTRREYHTHNRKRYIILYIGMYVYIWAIMLSGNPRTSSGETTETRINRQNVE